MIKFFEVLNKKLDIKTGQITLSLTDTAFATQNRYCLISPSSFVKTGLSTTQFIIKESYSSPYGTNEYKKWENFADLQVRVRSADFTTRNETRLVSSISGNTITLATALSFTPFADDIMELSSYNNAAEDVHLLYGWMRDTAPFDDGTDLYLML